jgi:hypothetical protein
VETVAVNVTLWPKVEVPLLEDTAVVVLFLTARTEVPVMEPLRAVIVEVPTATALIRPFVVVLTVATAGFEEYQFTDVVISFVLLSL